MKQHKERRKNTTQFEIITQSIWKLFDCIFNMSSQHPHTARKRIHGEHTENINLTCTPEWISRLSLCILCCSHVSVCVCFAAYSAISDWELFCFCFEMFMYKSAASELCARELLCAPPFRAYICSSRILLKIVVIFRNVHTSWQPIWVNYRA